jgi:hypothetical protein
VCLRVLGQIEDWIVPFPYWQTVLWSIDAAPNRVMCVDGRYGGSVQAGEAVVAKQADGQERNECREDFRPGWKQLSVLMIVGSKMILGSDLMKGRKK